MSTTSMTMSHELVGYELRYESIFKSGRGFAFPCDATGKVDMDALSDTVRASYLYARTVVGREFLTPAVVGAERARPRSTAYDAK
jgi:hypothetical protein